MQTIVRGDLHPAPPILAQEHYRYLGSEDIGFERYYSREVFDLEMQRVWRRTWQWACREEHIPDAGDQYVYEIGRFSILVVRTDDRSIRAFHNSCLHRGTKLRPREGMGAASELRCPYHGWTWTLDGALKRVPCAWDFPHVDPDVFRLPEVRVGLWGGFVFVNLDPAAPELADYLGVMREHFAGWDLENRYVELHIAKELPCNWKTAQEAFMESYHVLETHPQLLYGVGDANVQYDVYDAHMSRFYAASGVNSPHLTEPLSEQDLVSRMMVGDRSVLSDELTLKPGETARVVMARYLRKVMGEKYAVDLSGVSDSEMIDTIEYNLFPNMVLFPGLSLPMVYRFRPLGLDPERSLFELLFLRPVSDTGERPEPAEVVRVGEHESYSSVPGMDAAMGWVYDQDTDNLRAQQQGFHASAKGAATLSDYQEVRIRHFHQTLDAYLARA